MRYIALCDFLLSYSIRILYKQCSAWDFAVITTLFIQPPNFYIVAYISKLAVITAQEQHIFPRITLKTWDDL